MWVYREVYRWQEGGDTFAVGFMDRDDDLIEVEYHDTKEEARAAVHYLNGGCDAHTR